MRFTKFHILILACVATSILSACSGKGDEPVVPEPGDGRTVLVYMVAANSLGRPQTIQGVKIEAADSLDLREMQLAASRGSLNGGRWLIFHSTYTDSKLEELTPSGIKVIKTYTDGYATDAALMSQVIDDAKAYAPSDSYGLVLWSHANGWLEDGNESLPSFSSPKLKSYGQDHGRRMNVTTLAEVLNGKNFDYIYFDCCLMGSIEVMYQLRHCARYIISSPSELPREGMRYDLNMAPLIAGDRNSLVEAASNTFRHYNALPSAEERTATMTVIDTQFLGELASATSAIYNRTPLPHPLRIKTNYYGSETVSQGNYLDFGEYVTSLAEASALEPELVYDFNRAMVNAIIYHDATDTLWDDWVLYNPTGLSTRVFIRETDLDGSANYSRLQWTRDVVTPRFKFIQQ